MTELTQELLSKIIQYNPLTGMLKWLPRPPSMFPNNGTWKSWNSRCAGKFVLCVDQIGYISTSILDKKYHAHRLAFFIHNGYMPEIVDHVNGIKTDNRAINLRAANKSLNACNSKMRSDNTSGIKGVGWHSQTGKWRARVVFEGVEYSLGLFVDKLAAELVVKGKRAELHKEFAKNK
jgi:hypothetical protein